MRDPQKGDTVYILDPRKPDDPIKARVQDIWGAYLPSVRLSVDAGRRLPWTWREDHGKIDDRKMREEQARERRDNEDRDRRRQISNQSAITCRPPAGSGRRTVRCPPSRKVQNEQFDPDEVEVAEEPEAAPCQGPGARENPTDEV